MSDAYPELAKQQKQIEKVLLQEEEQFTRTLDKGMKLLEEHIAELDGNIIAGDTVFTLYDTYGFPVDLTEDIARERNLSVDTEGFEKALEAQRERARASSKFGANYNDQLVIEGVTEFTGYETTAGEAAVHALFVDGQPVDVISEGQQATVVLDKTSFYGESGGQVGDTGIFSFATGSLRVMDTQKQGDHHLHLVEVTAGELKAGQPVSLDVDAEKRHATSLNHSATHLLDAALRQVLGEHVVQKGSLVDSERLRFDFSHLEAVTSGELQIIESLVNQQIRANTPVKTELMDIDSAMASGAIALFGEKYADEVRVLTMGVDGFSVELCGGTHASRTGDLGVFHIVAEKGIAAGVRRIEAVTGAGAEAFVQERFDQLDAACRLLKTNSEKLQSKLAMLIEQNRSLEKDKQLLKQKLTSAGSDDLLSQAIDVKGVKLLVAELEGADPKSLRDMVDQLKSKLGTGVVFLATKAGAKVALIAGVTKDITDRVKAGDLLKMAAAQVGGKGGGRPDIAQGGGSQPEHLAAALSSIAPWLEEKLSV